MLQTKCEFHPHSQVTSDSQPQGMTREVGEFLRHKFLKSIQDAESELSGFSFMSDFEAIKCFAKEIKIIRCFGDDLRHQTVSWFYEINDALTECRVFANECKELNKKLFLFHPFVIFFILKMKKRLNAIKRKFAALVEEERVYSNLVIFDQTSLNAEQGGKIDDQMGEETSRIGDDEQADKIEGLLLGGAENEIAFTAIGIVGIAGVGKTTLVHQVLKRQRVRGEFSPIIWLCLSDIIKENHEFTNSISIAIVTRILDKLGAMANVSGAIVVEEERDISSLGLEWLLEMLNQLLSGTRYLIVLDDVWHISEFYSGLGYTCQDRLSHGLPKGSGGAVIVTTRIPRVAQHMVDRNNVIHVKPLDRESCWRIFMETVKDNNEVLNMSTQETLYKIKNEIKDQCYGLPLAAKELAGIIPQRIREIESDRFLEDMYIPDELLQPDINVKPAVHIPKFPVLVFIGMNNKQLGEKLLAEFRYHLNKKQVFAVLEENSDSKQKVKADNPEMVLKTVYGTLEKLKQKGYGFADEIQKTMTVIIVGGDSVANWILGVICDLKLPELPSIAPIPLEIIAPIPLEIIAPIDISISISFGWVGHLFFSKAYFRIYPSYPVRMFLLEVQSAKKMKTDSWHILVRMKATKSSAANQEIPHSLHLFRSVHEGDTQNADNLTFVGGFWNYFILEVDAPRCGNHCFHPTQRTLSSVANIKVMKQPGQWDILGIPSSMKSILCLNLPRTQIMKRDQIASFIDDGHLEIIGYRVVCFPLTEGSIHLDQVRGIRFEFLDGEEEVVNMTIDGASWENIPLDGNGITVIEITHHCQVHILAKRDTDDPPKSINDSSPPDASKIDDENNGKYYYEGHKKFGAASTFKIAGADSNAEEHETLCEASTSNIL